MKHCGTPFDLARCPQVVPAASARTAADGPDTMKNVAIILACLAFASCKGVPTRKSDPIGALANELNARSDVMPWFGGEAASIVLPPDAPLKEIVARAVQMNAFGDEGRLIGSYKIKEIRNVDLDIFGTPVPFTAVHIDSDLGEKVLLFKNQHYWWTRFYDARP